MGTETTSPVSSNKRSPYVRVVVFFLILLALPPVALFLDGITDEVGRSELVVVFGTFLQPDQQPKQALKKRLDRTLKLYRKGFVKKILVSGGPVNSGYNQAKEMQKYLMKHGVPKKDIIADWYADTVYSTIKAARLEMKYRKMSSLIIVADYVHVSRAKYTAWRLNVRTSRGVGVVTSFGLYSFGTLYQEVGMCLIALLKNYVDPIMK